MQRKLLLVTGFVFLLILLMGFFSPPRNEASTFHTEEEKGAFENYSLSPIDSGEYFLASSHCKGCHGYDSAQIANIDEDGNSVNLFDYWQSTMMANSARDPLWRAKVSHEILVNPAHSNELQNKCTECHAPMGRYTAMFHGIANYGLADIETDSLGRDGVSCSGCHTIDSTVGSTYSGLIPFDTTHKIYGPFEDPVNGPMQLYEGYLPLYSKHMGESRFCSPCHTLITQTVDLSGNYTGGTFPEQATYQEYLNSRFPNDSITCQTCHMPQLEDPVVIANGFASLQPRYPFNQHTFVGGNSFMLKLIKDNKVSLGAEAADWQFDTTIAASNRLLQESSVNFDLQLDSTADDTSYFSVKIENKAGHKFPSGYPSRRAVLQFIITDAIGDTLFRSGTFSNDYRVVGETSQFEIHHNIINQQNVPQIYEMAMGDVNGDFTSVLERAAVLLKDNRIPPQGFTTTSSQYDTVKISNDALADDDFNKVGSIEGSGTDYVHFRIPLSLVSGNANIYARIFYQAVPPKWVDEMFTFNSAEIDTFRNMFNNADQAPILMASDSIMNVALSTNPYNSHTASVKVYPTLTSDGRIFIESGSEDIIQQIDIFDNEGKKVIQKNSVREKRYTLQLPSKASMYFIKVYLKSSTVYLKVIRQ
jgi:hypothetical protein